MPCGKKGRDEYLAGHIPGAAFVELDDVTGEGGGRHPLPTAAQFEKAMRRAGVSRQTRVVAYDDVGGSVGPARGALGVPLERIVVIHDEIDFPFGRVETRLGGGLAGHNGLKSLRAGLGGPDFQRVRVGVGRPDTTDPDIVAKYVRPSEVPEYAAASEELTAAAVVDPNEGE